MGGSSSSSSSSTKNFNRDARVAGDNGAFGVSAEGDVHIVPDEAFALGSEAIREIAELAGSVTASGERATETAQGALKVALQGAQSANRVALQGAQAANRSEAANLSENIIKIGIPAAAIAYAVSQIWSR